MNRMCDGANGTEMRGLAHKCRKGSLIQPRIYLRSMNPSCDANALHEMVALCVYVSVFVYYAAHYMRFGTIFGVVQQRNFNIGDRLSVSVYLC